MGAASLGQRRTFVAALHLRVILGMMKTITTVGFLTTIYICRVTSAYFLIATAFANFIFVISGSWCLFVFCGLHVRRSSYLQYDRVVSSSLATIRNS